MAINLRNKVTHYLNEHFHTQLRYSIPKDFKAFFAGEHKIVALSVTQINIPVENNLYSKNGSAVLIELEKKGNIRRHIALIKDDEGNTAAVVISRDDFKPANREDIPTSFDQSEVTPHVVYGNASTMGEIIVLNEIVENPIRTAEKSSYEECKKMTEACRKMEIDVDSNIQLSGMSTIVLSNPENTDSINSSKLQKIIVSLFSHPECPFSDTVIIPGENESLFLAIKNKGGKTLLPQIAKIGNRKQELNLDEFKAIKASILAIIKGFKLDTLNGNSDYLASSFLSNIPHFMHLFEMKFGTNEELSKPPSLMVFVADCLINKINLVLTKKNMD